MKLTVVSKTSSTFGHRRWIGFGSSDDAKMAPSFPNVIITVEHPRHKKLLIARFASLKNVKIQIESGELKREKFNDWLTRYLEQVLCSLQLLQLGWYTKLLAM